MGFPYLCPTGSSTFPIGFPRSKGRVDGPTAGSAGAVALPPGPPDVALVPKGHLGDTVTGTGMETSLSIIIWLVVWNSRLAQTFQEYGRSHRLGCLFTWFRAMSCLPMEFSKICNGDHLHLVCKLVIFDHSHDCHLMERLFDGLKFHYEGFLDFGFATYTILNGCLTQQYPVPSCW